MKITKLDLQIMLIEVQLQRNLFYYTTFWGLTREPRLKNLTKRSHNLVKWLMVVIDRDSGFSKGFGFVNYATLEDAEKGVKGMDAQVLDGWVIFTEFARPKRIPGQ
ncbi:RNA-binding family protein with RRM/RBD/RNP motifs [Prunus dulcis]|uniref:RNA-binding family protein with RRM/RBD/RNP motifs n=1 Tax=Prunus dulcis TaxID=3755 RepID=A0A4Y1RP32_PRUDU|nr:RNA-binding family protein with RRM/RBD/RNP motifs [Prunus dulcis]